jgi:transposase-like protein
VAGRVPYSAQERAEAIAICATVGSNIAAERTGIAASTIRKWMQEERRNQALQAAHEYRRSHGDGLGPTTPLDPESEHIWPEYVDKKTRKIDVEKAFELASAVQKLVGDMGTGQGETTVKIDTDEPIVWSPSSDWHLFSYATDHEAFLRYYRKVRDAPHVYGSVHGDETDNFQQAFRSAAAVFGQIYPPHVQKHLLAGIYLELAERGKCLWRGWGNHLEDFDDKAVGGAIDRFNELVPYLKDSGRVHLWVGETEYPINTRHTFPGNSYLNANHGNKRAARHDWAGARIIVSGHTHRGFEMDWFWDDDVRKLALLLPTFKVNCTYSKRWYGQSKLGEPALVLYPKTFKVVPFDSIDDAIDFRNEQRVKVFPKAA